VVLGSGYQLVWTLVSVIPSPVLVPALLGAAPLLETDLSLPGLQDLFSLGLSLKHLVS